MSDVEIKHLGNRNVEFHWDHEVIGKLEWNDGVMKFTGNAEKSAEVFFNELIKFNNDAITELTAKLDKVKEILSKVVDTVRLGNHPMTASEIHLRKALNELK